jgi:hypothetical protein
LDDPRVQRRLGGCEVVPILQAELAAIQQRRGQPPIELTAGGTVLFALFDKQGKFNGTICSEEPVSVNIAKRLSQLQ